ncbi:neutral/alkaline non-lysosomal ceramidase N-terminal domain-containing protein [Corynebacterium sp. H113]|uniref:neutral/alkaline non-lysosomal ceramidase N-terminal domain-containing protein n=1 Tax=Corynebacterium sp. H113 TaxID=3133419 RepID=UPI0030B09C15
MAQTSHSTRTINRRAFLGVSGIAAAGLVVAPALGAVPAAYSAPPADSGKSQITMNVGRGMADMTGEPLGAGLNGYAVLSQQASGFRQRQFARAFIFEGDNGERVVHVTADMGLMFQSIQMEVLRRLAATYGDLYHEGNVLIGASHTHVAPGGTSGHLMVDLTTLGFRPVTFEAYVKGIVLAIDRAHTDLQPSNISFTRADVDDAGVNRSKKSFDLNPDAEKALFPDGVDREAATLHVHRNGQGVGFINWYGIHPTTFGPEHTIVSGDNKGYAAWLVEHRAGVDHMTPADAPFVAAFAMSTPGDVSPNHGLIPDTGPHPGNQYESARELGRRQVEGIKGRAIDIHGTDVDMRWQWVDMANVEVAAEFTPDHKPGKTGPAILGAAFAASSQEDGGGEPMLGFNEGERGGTRWVDAVNKVVVPPHAADIHSPKEMLLPVGFVPGLLQQKHIFHVHRIGGLTIASLAFEPTTMSGYRMRRLVADTLEVPIETVIVQGYVSGYGHYITTPEEYDGQDYEGGATAFGRLTLPAAQQTFHHLTTALHAGIPVNSGEAAGDLTGIIPPAPTGNPTVDLTPLGQDFGAVVEEPESPVSMGTAAAITFVGANPNSDLRHEKGFLAVRDSAGVVVADDCHENTVIEFAKNGAVTMTTITWIPEGVAPGIYTVEFHGSSRGANGALTPFTGSAEVEVR